MDITLHITDTETPEGPGIDISFATDPKVDINKEAETPALELAKTLLHVASTVMNTMAYANQCRNFLASQQETTVDPNIKGG